MPRKKKEEKKRIEPPKNAGLVPKYIEEVSKILPVEQQEFALLSHEIFETLEMFTADFQFSYYSFRGVTLVDSPYVTQLEEAMSEALKEFASKLKQSDLVESFIEAWNDYYLEKPRNYDVDIWILEFIQDLVEINYRGLKETDPFSGKGSASLINKVRKGGLAKENYDNPLILDEMVRILAEIPFYKNVGEELKVRATSNRVFNKRFMEVGKTLNELKELKSDVEVLQEKTTDELTKLNQRSVVLTRRIEQTSQETERRSIRNFVQIIGIFAAIIAFVVTMVPTAVRLGGASIPIALAGLAIVTVGIILVLAMIFGKREKAGAGLIAGVSITGVLFVGWLLLTVGLAFAKPNILAPRPDPVRVDTLYIETSPPPTPSLMEGDM